MSFARKIRRAHQAERVNKPTRKLRKGVGHGPSSREKLIKALLEDAAKQKAAEQQVAEAEQVQVQA